MRAGFNRPFGTYAIATLPGIEMPDYYHLVPPGQKPESRPDTRDFSSPAYLRSFTLNARIQGITQTVAEEIQRQQRGGQGDAGIDNHPPVNADPIEL